MSTVLLCGQWLQGFLSLFTPVPNPECSRTALGAQRGEVTSAAWHVGALGPLLGSYCSFSWSLSFSHLPAEGSQESWGPRNPHSHHFEAPPSLEPFPSPLCTDRHRPWQDHFCPLGDTGNLGKQVVSSHVLYGETEAQQAQPRGLGDMWLTKALLGFEVRPRSGAPVTSRPMWSRMTP